MEMTSRCLASFPKYFNMGRFHVSPGNLINSLNTGQHVVQLIRFSSALSLRCFSHEMGSARQVGDVRHFHTSCHLEAGHSKWKNIKHIKEASDKERGIKSNLLVRKLQFMLDRNPETDPRLNSELANLIKWARTNNLSNDVINNTIDRQIKLRDPKCIAAYVGRGPSNTGIVVECYSLKPIHTKGIIQSLVKKSGFNLNVAADDLFDHKGIVDVELSKEELDAAQTNPDSFPLDKYVEIAINSGAEDVSLETYDEEPYLQFLCGPLEVSRVSKALGEIGLNVINSEKTYIPKVVVPVTHEFMESVTKLTAKLDLNSDVIKYYFNVEPES